MFMKPALNQILYGPPGIGKTFHAITHAVSIVDQKALEIVVQEDRVDVIKRYDDYKKKDIIEFMTFHQSFT